MNNMGFNLDPINLFENECAEESYKQARDKSFIKLSDSWLNKSWRHKYTYHFKWMDRPIIQMPQDILALQEIIWKVKPDLIIETGIAHGGSICLSASLLALLEMEDNPQTVYPWIIRLVFDRNKMLEKGYNVCIFPEAHYWDDTVLLQEFKRGAFKIAIDNQLPIIPIIFYDLKLKHPWYPKFGSIGRLRVKVLDKINVDNLSENDIPSLTKKAFNIIKGELENDPKQSAVKAVNNWKKILNQN